MSLWRVGKSLGVWPLLGASAAILFRCVSNTHESPAAVVDPTVAEEAPPPKIADVNVKLDEVAPPPMAPVEPGRADLDPSNDGVVAPPDVVANCEERLSAAGIRFGHADLPLRNGEKGAITCGAEQVVQYRGSSSEIRYNAAPIVTCSLALALARFEVLLQDEAEHHFNSRVRRLEQGGTYNCRKMARFRTMVSEHSYANAIDFRSVTLADGRTIDVLHHFGRPDVEPIAEQGLFLRSVARRAYAEEIFSVVLTPFFDALHRDHFHLDMARYRVDGTR